MMKVLSGHLTAHDKKAINAILQSGLTSGKIGKKTYFLTPENNGYKVTYQIKDRGLIPCPGSQLRISTYSAKIEL